MRPTALPRTGAGVAAQPRWAARAARQASAKRLGVAEPGLADQLVQVGRVARLRARPALARLAADDRGDGPRLRDAHGAKRSARPAADQPTARVSRAPERTGQRQARGGRAARPSRPRGPRARPAPSRGRGRRSRSGPCSASPPRSRRYSALARLGRVAHRVRQQHEPDRRAAPRPGRGRTGSTSRRRRSGSRTRRPPRARRSRRARAAASRAPARARRSRGGTPRGRRRARRTSRPAQRASCSSNRVVRSAARPLGIVAEAIAEPVLADQLALLAAHLRAEVRAARGEVVVPARAGRARSPGSRRGRAPARRAARRGRRPAGARPAARPSPARRRPRAPGRRAAPPAAQTGPSSSPAPWPMKRATRTGRSKPR